MVHRRRLEEGEASMIVELKNGRLKVIHGTDYVVLLERKAYEGDWGRIWRALEMKEKK